MGDLMPNLPIMHVDAFVTKPNVPFTGNPAAVCLLDTPRPDHWLRSIAAEMNLSETAYLLPQANGRYQLRWFTPTCEVDLCGHATLAAAHALWETQHAPNHQPVRFDTRSGELIARPDPSGAIILDFPATPPKACDLPTPLAESLGIQPSWQGKTKFDAFLVIDEPSILRRLKPDFHTLTEVDFRGVIVTSLSDTPGIDFLSRFFAPWAGIFEDPATGSAHCSLGPYWASRLGKSTLTGFQCSPRGAVITVRQATSSRVELVGHAVTVARGTLAV
jgi:predicted PhzF superfamily epimerase YddE/YHI9